MKIIIDTAKWHILNRIKKFNIRWWRYYIWVFVVSICLSTLDIGHCWQRYVLLIGGGLLGIVPYSIKEKK